MSASNIIMYLLPLVVTPILSRLYVPAQFGEWGVFSSFIAILCLGQFAGFDSVLVKCKKNEVPIIATLCFFIGMFVTLLIVCTFCLGTVLGSRFFVSFPNKVILFVYLFFFIFYTIGYNLCNRYEMYTVLSINNILQGGAQAIFRVLLAIAGITIFNGLILGTTIALLVSFVFLGYSLKGFHFVYRQRHFTFYAKALIYKYRKFPLYDAPSSMLSFAAFSLPTIILASYYNKDDIGCFSIVLQLLLMPMGVIGAAMGRVYYQQLCKFNEPRQNQQTTERMFKVLGLVSIAPLLFFACGGDKLLVWFLGSRWHVAGNIALCLSLWSFPTILTQPMLPLFRYHNKQNIMLRFDILYFIGGIGSIFLCCLWGKSLYFVLLCFSVTCFLIKILLLKHIIKLGDISISKLYRFMPLWFIGVIILIGRLLME